jgi:hypothetical protein
MATNDTATINAFGGSETPLVVDASGAQSVLLPDSISLSKTEFAKSGPA